MKILSNITLFALAVLILTASVLLTIIGWIVYPCLWLGYIRQQSWYEKTIAPLRGWLYRRS
jgi:hypothetical protein